MDQESLEGKVVFRPPLGDDIEGQYDRWDWSLNFHGLEPSTSYTVQIRPGMADVYGNEITQDQTLSFTTAPYSPYASFNFPGRLALYRHGGSTAAWVTYRNLERLDVDLYRITPSQLDGLLHGSLNQVNYVPDATSLVWSQSLDVSAQVNTTGRQRLDLFTADDDGNIQEGELLPPGFYFITLDSPQIEHEYRHLQAHVLVMATANVTLKTTASEAMIWLTDLATGEPLADVPVAFFDDDFNAIFRNTTNANGLVYQDGLDLEQGYQERYYAISEDPDGSVLGMSISNWSDGVRPYEFGIFTDYYLQPERPTAYVYTDRPVYRPGQPVSFKSIVRLNDDLDYGLPTYETVDVAIASYDETVFSDTVPLSEFGSFAAQVTLDDEATLGSYRIGVSVGEEQIGSGLFQVAEYRKPTFQVEVTAAEEDVAAGDTIDLIADAQFFSGGSVVNGDVEWAVRSSPYTFSGEGSLSRYSFSNEDYYDGFGYQPSEIIARGQGQTDTRGRFTFQVPAHLNEEDGSRRFDIEATVTDIADNAVSGRTSAVVHRSQFYPGIRAGRYVGHADEEMTLDLVVVDWEGELVPDRPVTVEVVERRWDSVQEENEFGQTVWRTDVEEIPVDSFTDVVMEDDGRASVTFVPPGGGVYRAYVTVQDEGGNETTSSTYVWIAGSDYVSWRQMNDHSFELIADADNYRPGDTAELLIASPFQGEATALVTVERGHIKHHETIELSSNSTIYRLPITGDMAPNVFVSVLVIKGVDETNPAPDFKVGMTQFMVEREQQQLDVELVPDRTTAGPGDSVTYTVRVQDFRGRPVEAEVSLALADLAALSLAEPQVPSILDYFYSERWLSVETALLLTRIMDAFNQELGEEPKGGGGGPGELGVMTIREEFPDTAYWEGQLQTGPDGEATVTLALPDNLTTWRMEARAVTLDTKVGQTQVDIMTTRPLLVSPHTPRFFVVGDTARVGTAVHNNTDSDIEATVNLQADGATLNSPGSQRLTIPARQQVQVTWQVVVDDVERVDFIFSANGSDASGDDYFDASRPTLGSLEGQGIPVYRYQVPETVGTSGQLMEDGVVVESIGLPIFPDFELREGEVTVEVAPSLAAAMTEGLTYLEHYPYECTEQVVSRFLPNVLTSRALQAAGLSDPELEANLEQQVNVALQRLYSRQRPDGGWPWWDEPDSNTLVTAYVVLGLLQAQESGYDVSDDVVERGISYLQDNLPQVDDLDGRYKFNRQAFLAYVLARAGVPATGTVNRLYQQREAMDWYGRGFLAQAIQLTDEADPRLQTMAADFVSSAILSATGAHWEEAERDFWNWNSDTRTTAIVLDTMIGLDPQNPVVANAVRWLMAHRQNGRWQSTQETAWSIMALTEWMVASGELEADYAYEVALNGDLLGSGRANADTLRHPQQMKVDVTELFTDELNRLAIGRSEGPGNLYYTTHLQAYLPVEQVPALDRGITVSRRYYDPADRETPISEVEQGQIFLARLTVIVPEALHYVLIDDFLPAGLEAVDTSLRTSQQVGAPERYDWDENFSQGWGWWYFDHVELRDEKVVISADYLPAGTYEYVYLVRASTPGQYRVIPPTAQEFYFPEVYGRGQGSLFVVRPQGS
jgi:uncharacterized protein YfaS (alpha-2-macroglobulin family)